MIKSNQILKVGCVFQSYKIDYSSYNFKKRIKRLQKEFDKIDKRLQLDINDLRNTIITL